MPPSVATPSAPPMEMISTHEEEEERRKERERVEMVKTKLGKLRTEATKKQPVAPECPVCI